MVFSLLTQPILIRIPMKYTICIVLVLLEKSENEAENGQFWWLSLIDYNHKKYQKI